MAVDLQPVEGAPERQAGEGSTASRARASRPSAVRGTVIPPEVLEAVAELPAVVPAARAAEFLNVDVRTLRGWARSGKVRVLRTNPTGAGKVCLLRSEIARVLAGMMVPDPFQG